MTKMCMGFATSHSPMLLAHDDELVRMADRDKADLLPFRDEDGNRITYKQLLANADPAIAKNASDEKMLARAEDCRVSTNKLRKELAEADLDALIIIGDDQDELLKTDNRPSLTIFYGEKSINSQPPGMSGMPDWLIKIRSRFYSPEPKEYPNHRDLAAHIISHMIENDFDPGAFDRYPQHGGGGEGHAFAYVHSRIMDEDKPIPVVPVLLNTFYWPNKVTPRRAYQIGEAITEAVEAYPGDLKVGIMASGGLSHFMVDEDLDARVIKAFRAGDKEQIMNLPRERYIDGTSEILNWICVAGAMQGKNIDWLDYVPGYRSPAGTGVGLAFAKWS